MIIRGLALSFAGAASAAGAQMPQVDTLLDCSFRPAASANAAGPASDAGDGEPHKVALLMKGETTTYLDYEGAGLVGTRGDFDVFWNDGAFSSLGQWPQLLELGAAWRARGFNRESLLVVRNADLRGGRADAAVAVSEFVHGSGKSVVTGGYTGECRITEGETAGALFEDMR